MNPVLKYRGGKSREIPRFLQYIPDDFHRYIEPFFGGGAVFFDELKDLRDEIRFESSFYCAIWGKV